MADLYESLQLVQLAVYVVLGVVAVRQWLRHPSDTTTFLALTFGTLAVVVAAGRFLPEGSEETWVRIVGRILVALIALFPYFLWRFSLTFVDPVRWFWILAHVLTGIVVVAALAIELPEEGMARSPLVWAFIGLLLIQWVTLSSRVTWRLWRAGEGQPTIARNRMRTLALGAAGLALALVIGGLAQPTEEVTPLRVVVQLLALAAGPLFLLGFAPPGVVRSAWRRPEEEALASAERNLMTATTPREVAEVVLPHASRLTGGGATALVDKTGEPIGVYATSEDDADLSREPGPGKQVIDLENGSLILHTTRFAPFFGREENELMRTLAVLADLALSRADLFVDLRRSNAELEQFAYVASHDLQEPLRTVTSYAELLQRRYQGQLDEKADKYIWYVADGCTRMQSLINDLLAFSRIGTKANEPEPVEARDALDAAVGALSESIRATGADVRIGDLPRVVADQIQLTQLFQNMVGNAIKYRRPDVPPVVEVSARSDDSEAIFTVADNGIGIDPKYADRIFTIFQRLHTRDEYPGTGIGLAICKKIVERHGGRIWLDERPRDGSMFHFTLPKAR